MESALSFVEFRIRQLPPLVLRSFSHSGRREDRLRPRVTWRANEAAEIKLNLSLAGDSRERPEQAT